LLWTIVFLEIQFLAEIGCVTVRRPEFVDAVMSDGRFAVDDVPFVSLIRTSLALEWTRDPFDRLLAAHSLARRVPLCTLDRRLRRHHRLLAAELPSS
jgi:PIN domain nuclease of toxin-antitoxin system